MLAKENSLINVLQATDHTTNEEYCTGTLPKSWLQKGTELLGKEYGHSTREIGECCWLRGVQEYDYSSVEDSRLDVSQEDTAR